MTEEILDEQELQYQATAEPHFVLQMNSVGRKVALGSFAIGTFLLMIHLLRFGHGDQVVMIGLGYVALALAVNSLIFLLVALALFRAKNKRRVLATMALMLLNLPISFGYFIIVAWAH